MKNFKKIKIIILISIIILICSLSTILVLLFKNKQTDSFNPGKYSASILLETETSVGEKKHIITFKDDRSSIVIHTDYLEGSLYEKGGKLYLSSGGRYQRITREHSYKDLYTILYNLDFPKEDGNYNPKMESDVASDLLESLLIDSSIEKDVYSNISVKDGKIKKFSIYLSNIENFTKLNISISFDYLDDDYENIIPIFYDEVTDDIDGVKISISE